METSSGLSIPGNTSAALAQLGEHTSRYVEAGLSGAANTVKAYAGDWKRTVRKATNALETLQAALAEMETMLADEYVATPKLRKTRTPREATEGAAPKKPGRPKKTA